MDAGWVIHEPNKYHEYLNLSQFLGECRDHQLWDFFGQKYAAGNMYLIILKW